MIIRLLEKLTPSRLTETICSIPVIAGCNEEGAEGLWQTISLVLSLYNHEIIGSPTQNIIKFDRNIDVSLFWHKQISTKS